VAALGDIGPIGAKRLETRSWPTNYRGPLAIHATKTLPVIAKTLCRDDPFHEVLIDAGYPAVEDLPLGAVLCTVDLTDCTSTNKHSISRRRNVPSVTSARAGLPGRWKTWSASLSPSRPGADSSCGRGRRRRHTTRSYQHY